MFQGIADRPEEPEKKKQENRVGGRGRNEEKGEEAPVLPLEDEGGF